MATTRPIIVPTRRMAEGDATEPIIEDAGLRTMSEKPLPDRRISGKLLKMAALPEDQTGNQPDAPLPVEPLPTRPGRGARMDAVPGQTLDEAEGRKPPDGDQLAADKADRDEPRSVRLRLRIVDGVAQVIGIRVVPGVRAEPERLHYGLAYEVRAGNRRIAIGSVPDVGTRRSFPDPEGRPGMQGHHLAELNSIEVNLRLPHDAFTAAALAKLQIELYRMKGPPPDVPLTAAPLAEQFRDVLRPVAELRGIRAADLPRSLQTQLGEATFKGRGRRGR